MGGASTGIGLLVYSFQSGRPFFYVLEHLEKAIICVIKSNFLGSWYMGKSKDSFVRIPIRKVNNIPKIKPKGSHIPPIHSIPIRSIIGSESDYS